MPTGIISGGRKESKISTSHPIMKWSWIRDNLLPPLLRKVLTRADRRREEIERFRLLYGQFAGEGDLCFDIGANLGNRVRCLRALGCRVVAVEPQSFCLRRLRKDFGNDCAVVIVPKAAGAGPGSATMRTSAVHVLSTLSDAFVDRTRASGRFVAIEWSGEEKVEVTTMDALIAEHGLPRFVKVDVEGFEPQVLAGLSQAVQGVSFEWTPELPDNALACIRRLVELGRYEFNYSWGESMQLARPAWLDEAAMTRVVEEFAGENQMFGDIYARLRHDSGARSRA
jgi:FkbM family methyltransferase